MTVTIYGITLQATHLQDLTATAYILRQPATHDTADLKLVLVNLQHFIGVEHIIERHEYNTGSDLLRPAGGGR